MKNILIHSHLVRRTFIRCGVPFGSIKPNRYSKNAVGIQQTSEWLNTYGILKINPIIVFTDIEVLRTKDLNNLIGIRLLINRR